MAGFYIGVVTNRDVVQSDCSFYLFRRHDEKMSVYDGEEALFEYLDRMRQDGDIFPAFDHFPEDYIFREMDGARNLMDDQFWRVRKIFIPD